MLDSGDASENCEMPPLLHCLCSGKHGGLRRFFLFSHPRQCKSARRRRSKHLVGKPPRVPPADILSVVRCDLVRPTWCLMTCRGDSQRVDTRMVSFKSFRFFAAGAILGEI